MESEEDEIKSKHASKKDRTLILLAFQWFGKAFEGMWRNEDI